jgi:D-alanyl-lipoteichoic acid acyltransferase DltB (MBOAT superfamily)
VIAVAGLVATYCWLKHYAFVPHQIFLAFGYFTIGISYVFFRVLHLVIDAYQDALGESVSFAAYVSYTLNFTALVSGPIQFYRDYRRTEIDAPATLNGRAIIEASDRIITGFFKTGLMSPVLSTWHAHAAAAITTSQSATGRAAWAAIALVVFPIYLYVNFSGYTDFVIGTARMLRLVLPENFNRPFMALGFIDFWSRWHMTLSLWFKTYVYSTLLLWCMRKVPSRRAEPYLGVGVFFVTFFLVGLWHGQTSEFIVYGLLQGAGVSVNKLYQLLMIGWLGKNRYRGLTRAPVHIALSRGITFVYFSVTLLWFWSSWQQLGQIERSLGFWTSIAVVVLTVIGATLVLVALKQLGRSAEARYVAIWPTSYARTVWLTALAVMTISVTAILNAPAPHIVYRAF